MSTPEKAAKPADRLMNTFYYEAYPRIESLWHEANKVIENLGRAAASNSATNIKRWEEAFAELRARALDVISEVEEEIHRLEVSFEEERAGRWREMEIEFRKHFDEAARLSQLHQREAGLAEKEYQRLAPERENEARRTKAFTDLIANIRERKNQVLHKVKEPIKMG